MKKWKQSILALGILLGMAGCAQAEPAAVTAPELGDMIVKIADQDSYVVTIENTDPQANENVVQTWTEDGYHYGVWEQESVRQSQSNGVDFHYYEMMKWNKDEKVFVSASRSNDLGQIETANYDAPQYGFPSSRAIFMELLTPGITEDKEGLHLEEGYHLEKEGEDTIVLKSDDKNGLKAAIQLKDGKITKIESTYEGNTKTVTVSVPDTASEAYKKKVEEILNTEGLEANDPLNGPFGEADE